MSPPLLVDVDLRRPDGLPPAGDRWVHALLWWGDRVLGEERFTVGDRPWAEVRAELLAPRAATVAALDAVTAAGAARPVPASDVTVVVCTRDRPRYLEACLEALARLDPQPAEVVVVDNAPTDERTREVAERFGVRRLVDPRPGLSHARNTGWTAARTPVVAYTDDDARPHRHWVGGLCRALADPRIECVTGLVVAAEAMTPAQRLFESNGGMRKGLQARLFTAADVGLQGWRLGVGANMAFRRDALVRIGGFDGRLGPGRPTRGGDDLDAFVRVLASGGVAAYQPDAVVRHVHRRDLLGLARQYQDNGTGYAALLHKGVLEPSPGVPDARRELARWRRGRHGWSLLQAVRRRQAGQVFEIVSELVGSRRGAAAFEQEGPLPETVQEAPSGAGEGRA